jgi:two-component system nitrate/nitrite response regulator NarL
MKAEAKRRIRVLLVDDHALFCAGVARLLEAEADFELVGTCPSVDEALKLVAKSPVDVVLLDYDLGKERGSDFLKAAPQQGFKGRVLIVTGRVGSFELRQLVSMGAAGIFLKHDPPELLAQGVREVAAGRSWMDHTLFQSVLKAPSFQDQGARSRSLSPRERETLQHLLTGLSNKEIGAKLETTEGAVKAILQQLFNKTGVRTRSQLVRIALEHYKDEL